MGTESQTEQFPSEAELFQAPEAQLPSGEVAPTEPGAVVVEDAGTAEEGEVTPERTFTAADVEEAKRQVQSAKDKEIAAMDKARLDAETNLAQMRASSIEQQQQSEARALYEKQQREKADLGDSTDLANRHAGEQELLNARAFYQKNAIQMAEAVKTTQAYRLSKETGVDIDTLMATSSPEEMKAQAKHQQQIADLQKKLTDLESLIVAKSPPQKFDQSQPQAKVLGKSFADISGQYARGEITREVYEAAERKG